MCYCEDRRETLQWKTYPLVIYNNNQTIKHQTKHAIKRINLICAIGRISMRYLVHRYIGMKLRRLHAQKERTLRYIITTGANAHTTNFFYCCWLRLSSVIVLENFLKATISSKGTTSVDEMFLYFFFSFLLLSVGNQPKIYFYEPRPEKMCYVTFVNTFFFSSRKAIKSLWKGSQRQTLMLYGGPSYLSHSAPFHKLLFIITIAYTMCCYNGHKYQVVVQRHNTFY